jgi:hypothetical protein
MLRRRRGKHLTAHREVRVTLCSVVVGEFQAGRAAENPFALRGRAEIYARFLSIYSLALSLAISFSAKGWLMPKAVSSGCKDFRQLFCDIAARLCRKHFAVLPESKLFLFQ